MPVLPATAQQPDLRHPVTLNFYQEPLSSVMAAISQQTHLRFSYNTQLININKKITVQASNRPLNKVLRDILPSTVAYKQVGKYIILTAAAPQKKENKEVTIAQTSSDIPDSVAQNNVQYTIQNPVTKNTTTLSENDVIDILQEYVFIKNDSIYLKSNTDTIFIQNISVSDNGILPDTCHTSVITIKTEKMKKNLVLLIAGLLSGINATAQIEQQEEPATSEAQTVSTPENGAKHPFQATFIFPLGTDGIETFNNEYNFSLNILGGATGKVTGTEIGGLVNVNKYSVNGVQVAGLINLTGIPGKAERSEAVQIAGWGNFNSKGTSEQIAGIANVGDTSNVQVAGVANAAVKSKIQIAGTVNASETTKIQLAGVANVALESTCQISGVVNVTKKGRFQLGVVNVRDTADGVSLGIVNIVKKGGLMELEVGGGEIINTAVSFRSGTSKLYGIITAGINFSDEFFTFGYGLGTEFAFSNKFGLNLEGMYYDLHNLDFENDEHYGLVLQVRPTLNYKIGNRFKLFAGPTLNMSIINPDDIKLTVPNSIWNDVFSEPGHCDFRQIDTWVGFTAGVRYIF